MMKNWMKSINKYKWIILLVIIFLVLFINIINSIRNEKQAGVQNKGFNVITAISNKFSSIRNVIAKTDTQAEIENLKQENATLRQQLIENTIQATDLKELEALKTSLKFVTDKNASSYVSADIVAKNSGNYYKTFTISAGAKDGVKSDSIVVNGDGLIGRVYEISNSYSKAISILDNKSPISFEIVGRNSDTGMIIQDTDVVQISDEGLIKGYMFDANSPVKVGEMVATSGLGLYPSGIPIGTIEQIIPDEKNILKYVVVKPYADFTNINKILIFNKINTES